MHFPFLEDHQGKKNKFYIFMKKIIHAYYN